MDLAVVMAPVQDPNVCSTKHSGCPVVTCAFVHGSFAVALLVRRKQSICPEVGRMPGNVVPILVIDDSCVMRCVGPIAPTHRIHKRTVLQQLPAWSQMNLALSGDWVVLSHLIAPTG